MPVGGGGGGGVEMEDKGRVNGGWVMRKGGGGSVAMVGRNGLIDGDNTDTVQSEIVEYCTYKHVRSSVILATNSAYQAI